MPKHEDKKCPLCGALFECKVGSITICQCADIPLSEPIKSYIQNWYGDCLCVNCLRELQAGSYPEIFEKGKAPPTLTEKESFGCFL